MRQIYNPENLNVWLKYYSDQANQAGYGIIGFRGLPYQRGAGLGSFFRSLYRIAVPILKTAASKIGKQALKSGADIMTDVVKGRDLKESFEEHAKEGVENLLNQAKQRLQKGKGLGKRPSPKSIKVNKVDIFTKQNRKKSNRTKKKYNK